ncbi:MAG: serine protease [Actinomycetota bacterium]|nr:serine protease [Actinomycetota bacterium]
MADMQGDRLVISGGGSGSIVSSDGLILTNAHVATPAAPGLPMLYGPPTRPNPARLIIALVTNEDEPPKATYFAEPVVSEGYLDLAVIRISADLEGRPVSGLNLPTIPIGDSDRVSAGEDLTVFGFPGIGGETLSVTRGIVSGFLRDDRLRINRGWIKSDVIIRPGNSGGVGVDSSNRLIGVPTRGAGQGIEQLRPINLAKPLIADAAAGRRYVGFKPLVGGTGNETLTFNRWGTRLQRDDCITEPVSAYPSGSTSAIAEFSYNGFTDGEDLIVTWAVPGERARVTFVETWDKGSSGQCFSLALNSRGSPLRDGPYELTVFAGPSARPVAKVNVTVGGSRQAAAGGAVTATGLIIDAQSGQPIPGAGAAFLKPGTDLDTWAANPTAEAVAAGGTSGRDGRVAFSAPLVRGVDYPYLSFAEGYVVNAGCCLRLAENSPNPIEITFKLTRRGPG